MIYVTFFSVLLAIMAGGLAYLTIVGNKKLTADLNSMRMALANEMLLRSKIEEANKVYVQKLATLSKGTDSDRFAAAASIMSDNPVSPTQPDTKP